jgi:ParB family transcriptional regulator, chromosome partitioning protein
VVRRSGLGKGLGALIPSEGDQGEDTAPGVLREVPLSAITPNPRQPRSVFDEAALDELAASIAEVGVLQPILVRELDDGSYELIAGERRWRASRRAGLASIPVIVREVEHLSSVAQALIENLHRSDLHALEEAAAYQALIEDFGLTHEQVAEKVGKSRSSISNTLRLLQLAPGVQHLLAEGRLSAGHAKALLGTTDRSFQEALARRVVQEGWSVRQTEEAVRARAGEPPTSGADPAGNASSAKRAPLRPPGLLELEELLSTHLDTRVSVAMQGSRGKVVIEFATLEDLERIYRAMTEPLEEV